MVHHLQYTIIICLIVVLVLCHVSCLIMDTYMLHMRLTEFIGGRISVALSLNSLDSNGMVYRGMDCQAPVHGLGLVPIKVAASPQQLHFTIMKCSVLLSLQCVAVPETWSCRFTG